MLKDKLVVVVMAGGSGTRFWPSSRPELPKQFLTLFGENSLIQETVNRLKPLASPDHIFVCSLKNQQTLLEAHLPEIKNLILEPCARNTAPCLLLSTLELLRHGHGQDTVVFVAPADHYIANGAAFRLTVTQAMKVATETKGIVTLGIRPTSPHTGYGYIEAKKEIKWGAHPVSRFIEKPSLEKAKGLIDNPQYYWNSGMFVFTLGVIIQAFQEWMPDEWDALEQAHTPEAVEEVYRALKGQPIDTAVMEKSKNLWVVPADFGWSDVGSWKALYELQAETPESNVAISGVIHDFDSQGCLIKTNPGREVVLVGLKDIVVVESGNTLLVLDKSHDQKLKEVVKVFEPNA